MSEKLHMLMSYVSTPAFSNDSQLPTTDSSQWGATGNAVPHHAEGITMKIEAKSATTNAVLKGVQGTTDPQKIVTGGVTMNTIQGIDDEAETEAGTGVVTRRIAEEIVKSAPRCYFSHSSPLTTRFTDGRGINLTNAKPERQRRRG